jgi:hypothetical protein
MQQLANGIQTISAHSFGLNEWIRSSVQYTYVYGQETAHAGGERDIEGQGDHEQQDLGGRRFWDSRNSMAI